MSSKVFEVKIHSSEDATNAHVLMLVELIFPKHCQFYLPVSVRRGQVDCGHDLISEGVFGGHEPVRGLKVPRLDVQAQTIPRDPGETFTEEGLQTHHGAAPRAGEAHQASDVLATPTFGLPEIQRFELMRIRITKLNMKGIIFLFPTWAVLYNKYKY